MLELVHIYIIHTSFFSKKVVRCVETGQRVQGCNIIITCITLAAKGPAKIGFPSCWALYKHRDRDPALLSKWTGRPKGSWWKVNVRREERAEINIAIYANT